MFQWLRSKESARSAGDTRDEGLIPLSGRSPEEGSGNPPQYSCMVNSTDRRAWWAILHGVTKSRIRLKQLSTHVQRRREIKMEIVQFSLQKQESRPLTF